MLERLNAVRMITVLLIALGYASTMPLGPGNAELLRHFGYDPSWYGVQVLFVISGFLGLRSLDRHGSVKTYLSSRAFRTLPILALYTFAILSIVYPLFCAPGISLVQDTPKLIRYFLETVTLIDPGQPLPGLMDDALYMCLVQGAIWTLRWGAAIHIAMALGWHFKLLRSKHVLLVIAVLSILSYCTLVYYMVNTQTNLFEPIIAGMRLGYAFLIGAAAYAWRDVMPKRWTTHLAIMSLLLFAAYIHFVYITWSPMIEVLVSCFWSYLALALVLTPARATQRLRNWPNLTAPLYFSNWPITQILLLSIPSISVAGLVGSSLILTFLFALLTSRLFTDRMIKNQNDLETVDTSARKTATV